jgi:putative hydrolase of the HAD superfamily
VKAVLFDLDDTLLDYSGGVDRCWEASCLTVAAPAGIDPAPLIAALAESRRWFWSDPDRHRRERTDMLGAWRKIFEHALGQVGGGNARISTALTEDFAARRRAAWRLFPESIEVLRDLRQRDARLALVTNGDPRHQRDKIEQNGLAPFFDVIVIEGEFGVGKPEPIVYRHALDGLAMAASEAVMVGDHLEWDVSAPQRLGMRGIWIDREGRGLPADTSVSPDRIIRNLRELLDGTAG